MQILRKAAPAIVSAIALYFALLWGWDALNILTSPIRGMEDDAFARTIFGIGKWFGLTPNGVLQLAAFLGGAKLAVATVFALHVGGRIRALWGRKADHDVIEAALLLAVAVTVVSALPAIVAQQPSLLQGYTLQLGLAGIAAIFSVMERVADRDEEARTLEQEAAAAAAAASDTDVLPSRFSAFR